ncbi:MAG: alpha-hydroxy acid oxidase [Gemmatimonadaceae bacterium]
MNERGTAPVSHRPANVAEYEALARQCMEPGAYDYYAGAACDECTLTENRRAFERILLRPRVLVDASRVDATTSVLGQPLSMPVMLAPTALNKLAHPDGELAAARAARAAGTIMVASTAATYSVEEIAEAGARGTLWFQVYICKDRGFTRELVRRADAAGCQALVLTADVPYLGRRERDVRNAFEIPPTMSLRNFEPAADGGVQGAWSPHALSNTLPTGGPFDQHSRHLFDPSITWDVIDWLRSITSMPVLVKGILTPEDARLAVERDVSGIIVSNHGGRQLDSVEPTISALPRVVDAVAGRTEVLMDGGVRRGTDVLKALALGARAVLVGRAYLWGLAVAGEAGVSDVLELLRAELTLAMALSGRPMVAAIDRSLVSAPAVHDS